MKKLYSSIIIIGLLVATQVEAATLSVVPSTKSVTVGESFEIDLSLDTEGASIDGIDIFYLNSNPSLLEVIDQDDQTAGIQIEDNDILDLTVYNDANNTTGEIALSQISLGGSPFIGSGNVATVAFRALAAGTANLIFDFTLGDTSDSNVASNGADILTSVANGVVTISVAPSSGGGGGGGSGGSTTVTSGGGGGSSSGTSSGSSSSSVSTTVSGGGTTCAPGLPIALITSVVGLGSKGQNVTNLQKFLVEKNYLTADNVTGFFGSVSQAALQKFQKAEGIISFGDPISTGFGNAGPATRVRINSLIATSVPKSCATQIARDVTTSVAGGAVIVRNIALGARTSDVQLLQKFLISTGYLTADNATGYFGYATQAAVQAFQRKNGIVSAGGPNSTGYGAVGPITKIKINALLSVTSFTGTGTKGSTDSALEAQLEALQLQAQELLKKLPAQ